MRSNEKTSITLRYGVMVAQEILALLVRVRVLISQQKLQRKFAFNKKSTTFALPFWESSYKLKMYGAIAQLVRAHDS